MEPDETADRVISRLSEDERVVDSIAQSICNLQARIIRAGGRREESAIVAAATQILIAMRVAADRIIEKIDEVRMQGVDIENAMDSVRTEMRRPQ